MTQPKPTELKLLGGTARPDREQASVASLLPRMEAVPPPPEWLTLPAAVREWNVIAPMLVECGVMRPTMLSTLGHVCMLHAHLLAAYEAGETPRAALVAQYRALAGSFGLTAVDSRRMPPSETRRAPSIFERLKQDSGP